MPLPARDAELIQIMSAAFRDAASRAGPWLVCREGCTQCCHGAFAINALDAARLRTGLDVLRADQPALAADLMRRAHQWIAEHGPEFPGDLITGQIDNSDEGLARFEVYANEAACPALDEATGRCDVYEWRPMTCRVFGPPVAVELDVAADQPSCAEEARALAHCELCFISAGTDVVEACEMTVPHGFESAVLDEMNDSSQTVVAFALLGSSTA